jgi:hypothetical protein
MGSFSTTAICILTVVVLADLIQPCTAPPLAIVLGVCGIIGVTTPILVAVATAKAKPGKRDLADHCPIDPRFSACIGAALKGANVTAHINEDYSIIADGLPSDCIVQIEQYNSSPDIESLNAEHETLTVLNGTAIGLSGIPKSLHSYIDSIIKEVK